MVKVGENMIWSPVTCVRLTEVVECVLPVSLASVVGDVTCWCCCLYTAMESCNRFQSAKVASKLRL